MESDWRYCEENVGVSVETIIENLVSDEEYRELERKDKENYEKQRI